MKIKDLIRKLQQYDSDAKLKDVEISFNHADDDVIRLIWHPEEKYVTDGFFELRDSTKLGTWKAFNCMEDLTINDVR